MQLECGPMPNLMVALPNIGGALCSTPQSLADAHYYMPCSNAAKTRNQLKFAWVPKNGRTDHSRYWAEVHHIMRTCGGDIAA